MYICRVHPFLFINRRWVYILFSFLHIDSRQNQATNMAAIPTLTLLRRLSASTTTATELLRSLCTPITTPEPLAPDGNIVHISDNTIRNERKQYHQEHLVAKRKGENLNTRVPLIRATR
jgi:hypothetical protein